MWQKITYSFDIKRESEFRKGGHEKGTQLEKCFLLNRTGDSRYTDGFAWLFFRHNPK